MQLNKDVVNCILQFKVVQDYSLTFVYDDSNKQYAIILTYNFGMTTSPALGRMIFNFLSLSDINLNITQLELAKTQSTYFAINYSDIRWSYQKQCFYASLGSSKFCLPSYLNNIIFRLIKFFITNRYSLDGIAAMRVLQQQLQLEGIVVKVTNDLNYGDELV